MAEAGVLTGLLHQALLLGVAVAVLWAARRPLLRLGATAVYAAWLLLPALLLTPALPRPAQEPLHVVMQAAAAPATLQPTLGLPAPVTSSAAAWLALWLAGAVVVVAVQARRQWRLSRFGTRLPTGSSPALVGLLRPRVALPEDFEQRFSAAERVLILAHEQVHLERLDNFWNLLACALTALHWWNPLAWWAARRMQADQELACDAAVLARHPGSQPTYTRALMAAHGLQPPRAPLASRWGSPHPLVERIAMLNQPRPLNRRRALLLAAVVASASALAYAVEAETPADKGYIQLELKIERSLSGATSHRTTQTVRLIGKDGERMMIRMDPVATDQPNFTTRPVAIDLRPRRAAENQVLIETRISQGDPSVELGHPSVVTIWDEKARIEIDQPESGEKFTLELTPSAPPADFKPPMPRAAKPKV